MCDLDIEIAKIQTDLKWIKNSNTRMQNDVGEIKEILTKENERINKLNKCVFGNGDFESSLTHRAKKLEECINKAKGAVGLIVILGISNIVMIIKIFA